MNTSITTAIVSACLLAAVWIGMRLRRSLPEDHLSAESKETVKLAMGLIASMSALLLGLLVSSAKDTYDTTRVQVMQKASKYALLDRMLTIYGPQAADVRTELHGLIAEATRRMWPNEADIPPQTKSKNQIGDVFYLALLKLEAHDDIQITLKAQAVSLTLEIGQLYSLMQTQSTASLSKPMLAVVVLWLMVIFLGFSLISPPNATTRFALIASALCTAGAIFLILELGQPFSGLMRISSEPMANLLHQLEK